MSLHVTVQCQKADEHWACLREVRVHPSPGKLYNQSSTLDHEADYRVRHGHAITEPHEGMAPSTEISVLRKPYTERICVAAVANAVIVSEGDVSSTGCGCAAA